MNIEIEHNLDWWDGGIEIDGIIRNFAEKCNMNESSYSKYNPRSSTLEYSFDDRKQYSKLKEKIRRSKKLKGIEITISLDIKETV